ncbi:MAG: hypothetical protein DRG58_11285 [Deltaproteobacteria bacterium]|nr:MAG: hypothetical protein DRG58_11285 [Deltaproteobacteria bacterium]
MKWPKPTTIFKPEAEKKKFPWGKLVYFTILGIIGLALLQWLWNRTIYIEAPALVQSQEIRVQATETGRIESILVKIGDVVTPQTVVARLNITRRLQDQWSPEMIFRLNQAISKLEGEASVTARQLRALSNLASSYATERQRANQLLKQKVLKYSDYKRIDLEFQSLNVEVARLQQLLSTLNHEKRLLEEIYQRYLPPQGEVKIDLTPAVGGIVVKIDREPGEVVLAGQPVLTTAIPKNLFIKAFIEEKYQPAINLGDNATILFKDGSQAEGQVQKLYPASEPLPPEYQEHYMTRQRAIVAEIIPTHPDPQKMLYGLTVKVRFQKLSRHFE